MTVEEEHEAFKNRLVEDVLGSESGDKVPMEKVVMLLWQFRDDPSVITFMARFVAKYAGSRHVFDGIEFYLPQLAHMIIHLEIEWDDAILERFALVIAQQSLHFALQFNWILQGALQDYQPELPPDPESEEDIGGMPNPNYNPVFYTRCLKLLRNVERCVVYGKPRAAALQRLYEQGKITKNELILLEQADRRFNALQITAADDDQSGDIAMHAKLEGWVEVQLPTPLNRDANKKDGNDKNNAAADNYVQRFCTVEKHVLNCYKSAGGCSGKLILDRAMSLERAVVSLDKSARSSGKKSTTLHIRTRAYQFRLRFAKPEETRDWLRRMKEEADTTSLFQQSLLQSKSPSEKNNHSSHSKGKSKRSDASDTSEGSSTRKGEAALKQDLTPEQLDRYEFFQNERLFVESLTDLAEELRAVDRAERKTIAAQKVAELVIPSAVYLPLCNSSHIWRRVSSAIPKETRVFNTKERCPVIMHFITKRGEWHRARGQVTGSMIKSDPNLDVAEYMHSYLEVSAGITEGMDEVVELTEEDEADEHIEVTDKNEIVSGVSGGGLYDDQRGSEHGGNSVRPNIWQEEDEQEPPTPRRGGGSGKEEGEGSSALLPSGASGGSPNRGVGYSGNRHVQRLLRESVVVLPAKLAKRLNPAKHDSKRRVVSFMDKQTELQPPVPILDDGAGARRDDHDNVSLGEGSVVSIERSSMLVKDQIVMGDLDEGDIDFESISRAKEYICGGESWAEKSAKMLETAIKEMNQGHDDGIQMEVSSCMAKSNDDLRQEVFVMQMIHYYKSVFATANLPIWLKTYRILSTSSSTGLLEVLTDATSLDALKKSPGFPKEGGLRKYFEVVYGGPDSASFKAAQANFMQSFVGYAIVSYLLGLKDRHNGNIMIDTRGHLIYIDFGFAMGMAPGHEFSFERAPFKFTKEFVEVMGGVGADCYKEFERLFVAGMEVARKNSQIALGLVEIMMHKSNYPCFSGWRYGNGRALSGLEKRLMIKVPDKLVRKKALKLIRKSRQHFGTYLYDVFQQATNGYAI